MPPTRASASQSTSVRPLAGSSWPVTTVKWVDTPRWVTGMPAYAGAPIALVIPGTTSNGTPAAASASASSPPRPNTNGSPPFSRTTRSAVRPRSTSTALISSWVRSTWPGRLARGDQLGARGRELEQGGRREPVVHDDVGAREQLGAAHGEQAGITGPGADEVDGHGRSSPSSSSAPPALRRAARRRPRCPAAIGLASRCRVARSTMRPSTDGEQRLDRRPRRRRACASAPHGQVAAAAELGEERALGVDRARARRRRRWRRAARGVSVSSARHSTASAPCPTCGSITDGSSTRSRGRAARAGRARRRRPRSRRSSPAFSSRVGMLPRSSANVRSGRSAASCARAGAPSRCRPRAPAGSASSVEPTSASRGSARSGTAASTRPSGATEAGRSLAECTAMSARPSSTACCTSFTNTRCRPSRGWGRRCAVAGGRDDHQLGVATEQRRRRARPASGRARCRVSRRGAAGINRRCRCRGRRRSGRSNSSANASA